MGKHRVMVKKRYRSTLMVGMGLCVRQLPYVLDSYNEFVMGLVELGGGGLVKV